MDEYCLGKEKGARGVKYSSEQINTVNNYDYSSKIPNSNENNKDRCDLFFGRSCLLGCC